MNNPFVLATKDGDSANTNARDSARAASKDDGIAFNSGDYATDEEAFAALEVFLMEAFGVSDEA